MLRAVVCQPPSPRNKSSHKRRSLPLLQAAAAAQAPAAQSSPPSLTRKQLFFAKLSFSSCEMVSAE
jgi:hypothetical protein